MAEHVLFAGWCVMFKPTRGSWWSAPQYAGRTRAEAIAKYCDGWDEESRARFRREYARDVRRGKVKCVRYVAVHQPTQRPEGQ